MYNSPPDIDMLSSEAISTIKRYVDETPDKWLKFHLDNCVQNEWFEVAAYIRDVARERGVSLQ